MVTEEDIQYWILVMRIIIQDNWVLEVVVRAVKE
jgi:hypothetical protein